MEILNGPSMQCYGIPIPTRKPDSFDRDQDNCLETLPVNTSLVFQEDNQRDWCEVVRSTFSNEANAGLTNVSLHIFEQSAIANESRLITFLSAR